MDKKKKKVTTVVKPKTVTKVKKAIKTKKEKLIEGTEPLNPDTMGIIISKTGDIQIPFFDPYTGEANLEYEKLTGKKNPLLITIEEKGILTSLVNSIDPTKAKTEHETMTPTPKNDFNLNNRFIVEFPRKFHLHPFFISKTSRPTLKRVKKKIFGVTICNTIEVEEISFHIYDSFESAHLESLVRIFNSGEEFSYTLKILDNKLDCVERWYVSDCEIKSIDFGNLDNDGGLITINMVVKPKYVELSMIQHVETK